MNPQATAECPAALQRRTLLARAGAVATLGLLAPPAQAQALRKVMIVYPTRSQASWPFWIAKQAGIYAKYGLDVDLKFGVHPVGMAAVIGGEAVATNYGLEQVLAASVRDPALVMMGSSLGKGSFSLMASPGIDSIKALRGKRIGVGRVGDTPYFYTLELLNKNGLASTHVQWVNTGNDAATRANMLVNGQIDAALITSPSQYKLIDSGKFKELTTLLEHPDIPVTTVYVLKKSFVAANPQFPETLIKANAEAIKRFYDDKAFAVATYRQFDPYDEPAVARMYDICHKTQVFERVPVVRRSTLVAAARRLEVEIPALKTFDFATVVDNSVVRKLAADGWFIELFGRGVQAEQVARLIEAV